MPLLPIVALYWIAHVASKPLYIGPDSALYLERGRALLTGDFSALVHRPLMTIIGAAANLPTGLGPFLTVMLLGLTVLYGMAKAWHKIIPIDLVAATFLLLLQAPAGRQWIPTLLPDLLVVGLQMVAAGLLANALVDRSRRYEVVLGIVLGLCLLTKEEQALVLLWPIATCFLCMPPSAAVRLIGRILTPMAFTIAPWIILRVYYIPTDSIWSSHLAPLLSQTVWMTISAHLSDTIGAYAKLHAWYLLALPLLPIMVRGLNLQRKEHLILVLLWLNWLPMGGITILLGWRSGIFLVLMFVPVLLTLQVLAKHGHKKSLLNARLAIAALTLLLTFEHITAHPPFQLLGALGKDAKEISSFLKNQNSEVLATPATARLLRLNGVKSKNIRTIMTATKPVKCSRILIESLPATKIDLQHIDDESICLEAMTPSAFIVVDERVEPNLIAALQTSNQLFLARASENLKVFRLATQTRFSSK